MTLRDTIGLLASYSYASAILALAEGLRRWFHVPQELTRKLVHILAGMWVFGILALFDTWYIGIIPFATFIIVNYALYRLQLVRAVDAAGGSPGTVYFAIAVTLLFLLFWRTGGASDRSPVAVVGVMALTWGDALAALVGRRWGRRRYAVLGGVRSWEGSAVFVLAAFPAMLLTLLAVPGSALAPHAPSFTGSSAALAAICGAVGSALAEAVSPAGTDNLSVPIVAALLVLLIRG